MINSPIPPPSIRSGTHNPVVEITPPSPALASQSPSLHASQSPPVSFAGTVPPLPSPAQSKPSSPPTDGHGVHPSMLNEKSETSKVTARPHLVSSSFEGQYGSHAPKWLKHEPRLDPSRSINKTLLDTSASCEFPLPPLFIPHKGSTRYIGATGAELVRETKPSISSNIPSTPNAASQNQGIVDIRTAKFGLIATGLAEGALQRPEQKVANRRAIYKVRPDSPGSGIIVSVPSGLTLLPTPPLSSTEMASSAEQTSTTSFQSFNSLKECKKNHVSSSPYNIPMPNLDDIPVEIADLEAMENKHEAFQQLAGLYKQQKFLREAEETFYRQKIADLTAGLMAKKMENAKLQQLLQRKGVSASEIRCFVGVTPESTPLVKDASNGTRVSEQPALLDASRFAMLGKEMQFSQIQQFNSSQGSVTTFEADATRLSSADSAPELMQDIITPESGPILKPAPSMPLPHVPHRHRNSCSMIVPNSPLHFLPVARSRSLTEGNISSVPYLASFVIEQNMRRLEMDCNKSVYGLPSCSERSIDSGSEVLEALFRIQELSAMDEGASVPTTGIGQFSLVVEDVGDGVGTGTTVDTTQSPGDMSSSGLFISSGLASPVSTFYTADSSNDADISALTSTNGSPDLNPELGDMFEDDLGVLSRTWPMGAFDTVHTPHTITTDVPSSDNSTVSPSPRPASVADVTGGAGVMGTNDRALASSEGEVEVESTSTKSIEVANGVEH